MLKTGIRPLSAEELALVSGGAQVDTTDLGTIDVGPPDLGPPGGDDGWFDIDPPNFDDPYDSGPGDQGGGGGGGGGDAPNPLDQYTVTSLGEAVDQIVNKSPTLEGLVQLAKSYYGFNIAWTDGHSRTDYTSKVLYVKSYDNVADSIAQLVHELGHSTFDGQWTSSMSRDAAIQMGLKTEGEATMYSMAVQRELAGQGISMNLPAEISNAGTYNSIYDSYAAGHIGWDDAARQIGEIYRNGERIDVNGTVSRDDDISYGDYYGSWWDSSHPAPSPSPGSGGGGGGGGGLFEEMER